jgi:hypothetical protein
MALLKRKKKDPFKKIRALALKVNNYCEKFGHEMLWKILDDKNAIGSCCHCNQKSEVVDNNKRGLKHIGVPKKCPGKIVIVTPIPTVFLSPSTPNVPRRKYTGNTSLIRPNKPTPDPRGFYKRSPIDRVVEDAAVFGYQRQPHWSFDEEHDTRRFAVRNRARKIDADRKLPFVVVMRTETRK